MNTHKKIKLFLVDDDRVFLKSLEMDFQESNEYEILTFISGEECLTQVSEEPDLIVLDYLLDGIEANAMNGIETLDKLKHCLPDTPVVMLSGQDKIEVAVNCMHHGALDYVVKSETAFIRLKKIIMTNFRVKKLQKELSWYMDRM